MMYYLVNHISYKLLHSSISYSITLIFLNISLPLTNYYLKYLSLFSY